MRLSGNCAGLSVIYNEQYFPMTEHIDYENIFTPQGMLGHVSKHPNLDFLMNIFNIPRVYSVSGFGTWNVGQHTVAVAFLGLYWSAFKHYPQEKRDRLGTIALGQYAHEAGVGAILPFFKTPAWTGAHYV